MTVFGTGYLGATHAACMAELGHEVLGVDVDEAKLEEVIERDPRRLMSEVLASGEVSRPLFVEGS